MRKAIIIIIFLLIHQIVFSQNFFDTSVYTGYLRLKEYVPQRSSVLTSLEFFFENYQITNLKLKNENDYIEAFNLIDKYLAGVHNDDIDTASAYWKFLEELKAFRSKKKLFDFAIATKLDEKLKNVASPLDKINGVFLSFDVLNCLPVADNNWTFSEPFWQVNKIANSQIDTGLKIKCFELIGDHYATIYDFKYAISAYLDEEKCCTSNLQKANIELKIGKLFNIDDEFKHGREFEYEYGLISITHLSYASHYFALTNDSLAYYSTELLRLSEYIVNGGIRDDKNESTLIFAKYAVEFAQRRNIVDNYFYYSLYYLLGKYYEIKPKMEFNRTSFEYYQNALSFAIKDGDINSVVRVLNRISGQYALLKDSANVIMCQDEIIKINSKKDFVEKNISCLKKSDMLLRLGKTKEGYHLLASTLKAIDSIEPSFHKSQFYSNIYYGYKLDQYSLLRNKDSISHYKDLKDFSYSNSASSINEIHASEYDFLNLQNQKLIDNQAYKLMTVQNLVTQQEKEAKYYANFISELSDTISLFQNNLLISKVKNDSLNFSNNELANRNNSLKTQNGLLDVQIQKKEKKVNDIIKDVEVTTSIALPVFLMAITALQISRKRRSERWKNSILFPYRPDI